MNITAPGDHIIACTFSRSWRRVTCKTWLSKRSVNVPQSASYAYRGLEPRAVTPFLAGRRQSTSRWASRVYVMIVFRRALISGLRERRVTSWSPVKQGGNIRLVNWPPLLAKNDLSGTIIPTDQEVSRQSSGMSGRCFAWS